MPRSASRFKVRRRVVVLLIAVSVLVFGLWGAIEWEVHRLETAVWNHGDVVQLKSRKGLLRWTQLAKLAQSPLSEKDQTRIRQWLYLIKYDATTPGLAFDGSKPNLLVCHP